MNSNSPVLLVTYQEDGVILNACDASLRDAAEYTKTKENEIAWALEEHGRCDLDGAVIFPYQTYREIAAG